MKNRRVVAFAVVALVFFLMVAANVFFSMTGAQW